MTDIIPAATSSGAHAQGMLCPVCRVDLVLSDRQGIEIDYCPQCRGVWLDRGELDKIIERNALFEANATSQAPANFGAAPGPGYAQPAPLDSSYGRDHHGGGHRSSHGRGHGGSHQNGGFLGGLFRH